MTNEVAIGLILIFSSVAALGAAGVWAVHSQRFGRFRIRTPEIDRPPFSQKYRNIALNSTMSAACYVAAVALASDWIFTDSPSSAVSISGQTLGSLLLYDLLYYAMHRTLHRPVLMRLIHGVHHRVRYPTAMDSLYLNPVELIAGIALLLASVAIVGPVSVWAFLATVAVHSVVNIAAHTNLVLPHPVFALFNHWAVRHNHHHAGHLNKNYATIFPVWDRLFGTYKSGQYRG